MIREFLNAIPVAASSPLALTAYVICGIIFIVAGAKLRRIKSIMARISSIPAKERKNVVEIATDTKLPEKISAEQWLRLKQRKSIFILFISLIIAAMVVAVIALTLDNDTNVSKKLQQLDDKAQNINDNIKHTQDTVISTINSASLTNLEALFPLSVKIEHDVDGTILHLDGSTKQRVISFDKDYSPMQLYWGDRFTYTIVPKNRNIHLSDTEELFLEIKNKNSTRSIPLKVELYSESSFRIPGSSPAPFEAYILNPQRITDLSIKIIIYSTGTEHGRQMFKEALLNTPKGSYARHIYKRVAVDGLRLRAKPDSTSAVLRPLRLDTFVKVLKVSEQWCKVRLPEGRKGWVYGQYLSAIK